MAVEKEIRAPYAPAAGVLLVIRRRRERGLPEAITEQELLRLGVSEGNTSRTLVALKFLSLIDEEGKHTATFSRLARVSGEEYPDTLAEILRASYAPILAILDPATATDSQLHDAFRGYQPEAQRRRMITLFQALCREAGIISGGPPEPRTRTRSSTNGKPASRPAALRASAPRGGTTMPEDDGVPASEPRIYAPDYRLLEVLLAQLPKDGKWAEDRRERWIQAMAANVDLLIEVIQPAHEPYPAIEEGDTSTPSETSS